jgi:hypothetical protein
MFKQDLQQALIDHVTYLSTIEGGRGYSNFEGMELAKSYITSQIPKSFIPERQAFQFKNRTFENLIFHLPGKSTERVIVTAHYDSYMSLPGACDNASGVACLIELAKYLEGTENELSIDIIFLALEEPPCFAAGSSFHADSIFGQKVRTCINIDMLGWFSDEEDSQDQGSTGHDMPSVANFICAFKESWKPNEEKKIQDYFTSIPTLALTYDYFPGARASDSRSYAAQGFDTILINDTAYLRSYHYHKPTDTIENIDTERMAKTVECVLPWVESLLSK